MALETEVVSPPTFDVLPLSPEVRRAVDDLGYVHPTPVQRAVFEIATRGRDMVVQARTGTGKTAAFGLPLIDGIVRRRDAVVQALVLCPTRELALQVTRELDALSKHRGTRVVAVYGGAPMPRQVAQIREGAQILVGTPGRVLDHLNRGTFDPKGLRTVVLDESDEMLSMGFLPQISEIFSFLPTPRQTLLFSATLPSDIKRMAETRLTNPEFVTLSGDNIGALEIRHFVYLSRADKLTELVQVLETENPESAIIFCNTKDETKRVTAALIQQGYEAAWLNADLPQNDREKVMAATRQGKLRFLVATDVAARGIDISHLTHVMNFDFPDSAESYVHRTGRTGRAGRTGTAISLIEPSDIGNLYLLRLTYKLKPIERQLPSANEIKTRAESDLVRWFVDGVGARTIHPDDLALARRLLTHEQAEIVVAALLRDHLGARPDASEEAADARRARPPKAVNGTPEPERPIPAVAPPPPAAAALAPPSPPAAVAAAAAAASIAVAAAAAAAAAAVAADTDDEHPTERAPIRRSGNDAGMPPGGDVAELFVNLGRRQGAKPSDYERLLEAQGVPKEAIVYIRVRHRNAFVAVQGSALEQALSALNGAQIAGRGVRAEPSRAGPSDQDGDPESETDV